MPSSTNIGSTAQSVDSAWADYERKMKLSSGFINDATYRQHEEAKGQGKLPPGYSLDSNLGSGTGPKIYTSGQTQPAQAGGGDPQLDNALQGYSRTSPQGPVGPIAATQGGGGQQGGQGGSLADLFSGIGAGGILGNKPTPPALMAGTIQKALGLRNTVEQANLYAYNPPWSRKGL